MEDPVVATGRDYNAGRRLQKRGGESLSKFIDSMRSSFGT